MAALLRTLPLLALMVSLSNQEGGAQRLWPMVRQAHHEAEGGRLFGMRALDHRFDRRAEAPRPGLRFALMVSLSDHEGGHSVCGAWFDKLTTRRRRMAASPG